MEVLEPGGLAEVGALARGLEVQVLGGEVFLGGGGEGEGVLGVVLLDEVLDYGAGFPEDEPGVGVFDAGDAGGGGFSLGLGELLERRAGWAAIGRGRGDRG